MNDLQNLVRLGKQLSPLAAQMARRLVNAAPFVTLEVRISVDQTLRTQGQGTPELTPFEAMAILEPEKHAIPPERLAAHIEALNFVIACGKCKVA